MGSTDGWIRFDHTGGETGERDRARESTGVTVLVCVQRTKLDTVTGDGRLRSEMGHTAQNGRRHSASSQASSRASKAGAQKSVLTAECVCILSHRRTTAWHCTCGSIVHLLLDRGLRVAILEPSIIAECFCGPVSRHGANVRRERASERESPGVREHQRAK